MSQWIEVNKKLPELHKDVLIYAVRNDNCEEGVVAISNRFIMKIFPSSKGQEVWSAPWEYFMNDYHITHWMPLPDKPHFEAYWVGIDDEPYEIWECDRCGHIEEFDDIKNMPTYCINCGAKMKI